MPIEFDCRACGHRLRVPDAAGGRRARCPRCSSIMDAPLATESPSMDVLTESFSPLDQSPDLPNPLRDTTESTLYRGQEDNPYLSPAQPSGHEANYLSNDAYVVERAKSKLSAPAVLLMIQSCLSLLWVLFLILDSLNAPAWGQTAFTVAFVGTMAIINLAILVGAIRMMSLQGRSLAIISSILAMIPCLTCCFIGLPVGIWALVVLNEPMIIRAFRVQERNP
jgi:hypothetical protein